jgi:electron transfer flavoprotein alpha subunit
VIAVVPVRRGGLPAGGDEAVAECGGQALVIGEDADAAAKELAGVATHVVVVEAGAFAPAAWAAALAPVLSEHDVVVLPGSPDGRDLAPRLAFALGRPLLAGAVRVDAHGADLARLGGLVLEHVRVTGPFVATFQPGVRGVERGDGAEAAIEPMTLATAASADAPADAEVLEVLAPDVTTMDLAEAPRIVAGGAGLPGRERFDELSRIATALGASMGATRVVTDRGWVPHERQIGTTGVVVAPELYLAFGISGAVQHTSGLGQPDHVISVNTDPHCPMMQLADVAIVADAGAVLDELAARLGLAR